MLENIIGLHQMNKDRQVTYHWQTAHVQGQAVNKSRTCRWHIYKGRQVTNQGHAGGTCARAGNKSRIGR